MQVQLGRGVHVNMLNACLQYDLYFKMTKIQKMNETVSLDTEYNKISMSTREIHIMTKDLDFILVKAHRKKLENTIIF